MSKSSSFVSELLLLLVLLIGIWWYASTQLHMSLPGTAEQTRPVVLTSSAHDIRGYPSLSTDRINSILCKYGSPACGSGETFYQSSLDSGINDIYALAFFWHESNYGTRGVARFSKSIGNLRCIASASCVGGYAYFRSWDQGIAAWFDLIKGSVYVSSGLVTIEQIIPKYAPPTDNNDDSAYISNVLATVRSLEGTK